MRLGLYGLGCILGLYEAQSYKSIVPAPTAPQTPKTKLTKIQEPKEVALLDPEAGRPALVFPLVAWKLRTGGI